jgi:hypothetical protein
MLVTSRQQAALSARFLSPVAPMLEDLFLALRAETDQALGRDAPPRYGKPYPYGYCLEITKDVQARLRVRLKQPRHPGERAIKAYLNSGGVARRVWGALRERFFQNAFHIGGLYIDVSNDTVDVSKPKVEILPMDRSGLEPIRDAAHFARIAEAYWGVTFYANHALPSLAPLFPMIGVDARGKARLYSDIRYMVDLFRSSQFAKSERWLEDGPAPPMALVEAIRRPCPPALLGANPNATLTAALQACRSARADGRASDEDWLEARADDLLATRAPSIPVLERG